MDGKTGERLRTHKMVEIVPGRNAELVEPVRTYVFHTDGRSPEPLETLKSGDQQRCQSGSDGRQMAKRKWGDRTYGRVEGGRGTGLYCTGEL